MAAPDVGWGAAFAFGARNYAERRTQNMKTDPIQVDWRQYPIGTPAVFRSSDPARELKLIYKFDNGDVLFVQEPNALLHRRASTGLLHYDNATEPNDILLPWSHAIAEGHNPNKLTNEQVGEGYRLVNVHTEPFNPEADCRSVLGWFKIKNKNVSRYDTCLDYRLPIKPKLTAKDFPPGTAVRDIGRDDWKLVTSVYQERIYTGELYFTLFDQPKNIERSLDGGKTWLPC